MCKSYSSKDKVRENRGLIRDIKRAYQGRSDFNQYTVIRLFHEPCSWLCKRDITYLEKWLTKYKSSLPQAQGLNIGIQRREMLGVNNTTQVGDRYVAQQSDCSQIFLRFMDYCMKFRGEETIGGITGQKFDQ